jgi:hypothetical protein
MKIILNLIKMIGVISLLFIITIIGHMVYDSIDRTDTFYLKDAQLSDENYLIKLAEKLDKEDYLALRSEMNIHLHRLVKGKGVIYGYRWYSNGSVMAIDDEVFEKLTVWIPRDPSSYPINFDFRNQENVKALYITGSSAWPQSACSGYFTSGLLVLKKSGSKTLVSVKGVVTPADSRSNGDYCKEREVNIEFLASEIKFSQLTPWLGSEGQHLYDETYR